MSLRRYVARRWLPLSLSALGLAGLFVLAANLWMVARARGRIFTDAAAVPTHDFAIVLGTSPKSRGGYANPFFEGRMDAAAQLYRAGKVRHLLLSGDNSQPDYDEPTAMRAALLSRGVPSSAITLDYAGLRTLDTMARAVQIFGLQRAAIVTDDFHEARCLFLADSSGLEAVGFASPPVPLGYSRKTRLRELASRTVAWLDVYLLRTKPRYLGKPEPIALVAK